MKVAYLLIALACLALVLSIADNSLATTSPQIEVDKPSISYPVNKTQRVHRFVDGKAGVVCYALTNNDFSDWQSISCLPVSQVKDVYETFLPGDENN